MRLGGLFRRCGLWGPRIGVGFLGQRSRQFGTDGRVLEEGEGIGRLAVDLGRRGVDRLRRLVASFAAVFVGKVVAGEVVDWVFVVVEDSQLVRGEG